MYTNFILCDARFASKRIIIEANVNICPFHNPNFIINNSRYLIVIEFA